MKRTVFISLLLFGAAGAFCQKNGSDSDLNFEKRVVCEEGTGTWCGWCVRGIVSTEEMTLRHPDDFIAIAIHRGDELATSSYVPLIDTYFENIPMCILNRMGEALIDPSIDILETAYEWVKQAPAEAGINTVAWFKDESRKALKTKTTMQFASDYDDANFKLAFVILEDSVAVEQANYYANHAAGEMAGFEDSLGYVHISLDHVARTIKSNWRGISKSVPSQIVSGEKYEYEYNFTLPTNILDVENIWLVALLLNADTEEIVNAHKVRIMSSDYGTGITLTNPTHFATVRICDGWVLSLDNRTETRIFSLDGKEIPNGSLRSGVYIIKQKRDGIISVSKTVYSR